MNPSALIQAIGRAAAAWGDPEYPPRADAVEKTLLGENRFTEEALAFAINQQMDSIRPRALERWLGGRTASSASVVGVLNAGNVPLVELQDFLAVVLVGHAYRGVLSTRSHHLLPAFVAEIRQFGGTFDAAFCTAEEMFEIADAVIAAGTDETCTWADEKCTSSGISTSNRLLRGNRFGVAVLTGQETENDLEALAEDALLHEGSGCRSVAVVWAPTGASPDPLLDAFAHFRAVFPAHPSTPGSLAMPKAFLEAVQLPHAYAEGLEFLLSKGEPVPQQPAHVRWSEYQSLDEVADWIEQHALAIQVVVAPKGLLPRLPDVVALEPLGRAQRPAVSWCPDGRDVIDFLVGLKPYSPAK